MLSSVQFRFPLSHADPLGRTKSRPPWSQWKNLPTDCSGNKICLWGLKPGFIKSLLVPSAGVDVSFLVFIAACAACPGSLQMAGVGWVTPPFTCMPQMGLLNEETRAQAGLGEQIVGISFSKTLVRGAVNIYSEDLPCSEVGRWAMVSPWASCCAAVPAERPAWGCIRHAGRFSPLQQCVPLQWWKEGSTPC